MSLYLSYVPVSFDADLDSKISGMGQFRFYGGKGVTNVRDDELMPPVGVGWKRQ